MSLVENNKIEFNKALEYLKHDISSLRTGRATPAIVEDIVVEAYGGKQPLKAVASILVQDAKTLVIDCWDKSLMTAIDSALRASSLGINPVNDGKLIRLPLPELTQERRQDLIKVLHQKLEGARIAVRKIREDVKTQVDNQEKNGDISEDEKYAEQDKLDKFVKDFNDKIRAVGEEKETEINTI